MSSAFRAAATIVCLGVLACQPDPTPPPTADTRTPVVLPMEAVEAVRAEMRTMLSSLHELHLGLVTNDSALAHRAAGASGLAAAEDPVLEPLLPAEFLRLAMATHSGFDSVALAIRNGEPRDSLWARLPPITANCVACHAIYRLEPAVEPR